MSVELRLSNVDPPDPEPPRTIYTDIVALPDPVKLSITVRIFNYDDVELYMKVDGYNASWTFATRNLGILASGSDFYRNLDQLGSRARPAAETEEVITIRLRAYTDAGYTDLKWTFEKSIDVIFIKSDDGSWTEDENDNFDDGTVQGWNKANESGNYTNYPYLEANTDFVLSAAFSLRMRQRAAAAGVDLRARMYKNFTTANRNKVFAIINIRQGKYAGQDKWKSKYIDIKKDDDILIHLGRAYDTALIDYVPIDRWMRVVCLLPKDTALQLKIVQDWRGHGTGFWCNLYLDDFKIISKD